MIPLRRHRYTALTIILTGLVIWYLATAQDSTRSSPFYQKTAAAIDRRRNEGPQAPGTAHRQYLKGGSIRPPEEQVPIDTSPIDDMEDLMRQMKHQLGKDTDLTDQVEGLDRGLEDAEANARAGKTAGDIELEKQIIQARKREQEKLKNELRDQLKHKERERQKSLSGKYTNPNWVGAFEKEQNPVALVAAGELEKAPDLDPFRDGPAAAPHQAPVQIVREQAPAMDPFRDSPAAAPIRAPVPIVHEQAPAVDLFRDKPIVEKYQAPVPMGGASMETQAQVEQKSEQQQEQLVREQEYLHPVGPPPVKQSTVTAGKSKRPAVVEEELDDPESEDAYAALEAATRSNLALAEDAEEEVRTAPRGKHDPFIDTVVRGREARKASEGIEVDEGEYVPDRHAYKVTEHESGHQAKMGRDDADEVDTFENRPSKAKTTTTAAAAQPTKKKVKAAVKAATSSESAPTKAPAHKTPAELELSRLLALSPITIFSKTHCPYSKKAKRILTQAFQIMPSPYIVELDTHEHGAELQKLLKQKTGRGTVPNIIVNGKTLGGGDEVESLWQRGELRDKLRQMGGNRILSVEELDIQ